MVIFKTLDPDTGMVHMSLSADAASDLHTMLEMLDLDGFAIEATERQDLEQTKLAVMAATAT